MKQIITVCLLATQQLGCASTIGNLSYSELERDVGTRVYIGTKIDATFLASPYRLNPSGEAHQSWGMSLLIWPFALVDLPLSFVLDTVLLPYTLMTGPVKEDKSSVPNPRVEPTR